MTRGRKLCRILLGACWLFMTGCTTLQVVPPELQDKVNRDLPFRELLKNPLEHTGQVVVFGGVVLAAKRLTHGTQIMVLQLPLTSSMKPVASLQQSTGRFLALYEEFLDPATLPHNTRVTIVGEVSGMETLPLDESTYDFPMLVIKKMTVWPVSTTDPHIRPYPYVYPYWAPYWGPYWWW